MAKTIVLVEYKSDYTDEQRYALKLDGIFPVALDFDTREAAEAAMRDNDALARAEANIWADYDDNVAEAEARLEREGN